MFEQFALDEKNELKLDLLDQFTIKTIISSYAFDCVSHTQRRCNLCWD